MRTTLLPIAALITLAACSPATTSPELTVPAIGILEERLGANTEEASRFVVRAAFRKEEDGWRAYELQHTDTSGIPARISWTISRNGEVLGQVDAETPASWPLIADVGRQELADGATWTPPDQRTLEFSGWQGEPVHRPLIATSVIAPGNPRAWSEAEAPADVQAALRQRFRANFADVTNCVTPEAAPTLRADTDSDIAISRTYESTSGWRLASLQLTGHGCDGPPDGAYLLQTYAISPNGEVRSLGDGLLFLDGGDYDTDGETETIFVVDTYNTGGYTLFNGDFSQSTTMQFNYH